MRIFNSVNAKLSTDRKIGCDDYQCLSNITIVGMNDTPEPRYIRNMTAIIGAVCGAATAVPCALLIARFIRSIRRTKGVNLCPFAQGGVGPRLTVMSVCCLRVQALSGGFWSCADLAFCARVVWCL